MGQHQLAIAVADGPDAGDVRAHLPVCHDCAAFERNAERLHIQPRHICPPSRRQQHAPAGDLVPPGSVGIHDAPLRNSLDSGVQAEVHALLFVRPHQQLADLRVGAARDFGQHLNDRHLRADGREIARHFQPDHAAADADERFRLLRKGQQLAVRHNKAGSKSFPHTGDRRDHGAGAGRQHEPRRGQCLAACGDLKALPCFAEDPSLGGENRHAMRLHCRAHTPDERSDHAVLPRDDLRVVDGDVLRRHAVFRAVQRRLILLGAVKKALCRDAALVQTGAAQRTLFDQRRPQPRLSRAFRAEIAARAAADHDQIKFLHFKFLLPRFFSV